MNYLIKLIQIIKSNFIFCISAIGTLILHLTIAWQPLECLEGFSFLWSKGPLIDDSYIIFKISRDLADWFAGVIPSPQLTSGVQPLIAFLYAPFFLICGNSKEIPIHLALSLNAFIGLFAHLSLYCLLRKVASRSIATFLVSVWIWSPYVMNQTINGMETPLALLLLLSVINYYWSINQVPLSAYGSWLLLGILLGVGFWARVDLGFLGVAIVLDQAWLAIKDDQMTRFLRFRNVLLCAITALVLASPWMIFTALSTGNLVPISGRAVHQVTSVTFNEYNPNNSNFPVMMFRRFAREFLMCQPLAALFKHIFWQVFITFLSIVGFIIAGRELQRRLLFRPVWIFQIIILTSYIIFIGGFWHLNRYLYPVYTLMLLLHANTLSSLECRFKLKPWFVTVVLLFLFIPYAFSYSWQYYSPLSQKHHPRYLSGALFAKSHIPPDAKVGTFQSGCLSYWLPNQIINLDGVTNKEAYLHLKNKTLGSYLDGQQIDYLVEEVFLFNRWDNYLKKSFKHYTRIVLNKEGRLQRDWEKWGIYKRKAKIN